MANIAIDMTSTPRNKTGIGRYIKNLVENLQNVDLNNHFFLFIHDDDLDGYEIHNDRFTLVPVNSKWLRHAWLRIVWEQTVLPFRLNALNIHLLHSPNFTMPYLSSVKKVVTFHDLTYFFLPKMHTPLKRELFKLYIYASSKLANQILTISACSADDIKKYLPNAYGRTIITPLGAAPNFFAPMSQEKINEITEFYNLPSNYILYVGTIEPRKNILNLVKAYELLSVELKEKYSLVIVGKKGWLYNELFSYCAKSSDMERIHFTGFIEDAHLPAVYRNAAVFVYVSHYEGFGIPLLESMASHTPSVTSNSSSMKEIADDAALLCDPDSPLEISNAITSLLTDITLCNNLILKFPQKLSLYNWQTCAEKTLAAYNKALSGDVNEYNH